MTNTNLSSRSMGSLLHKDETSRYKTELCRSFAEAGKCKYDGKCQFAHGNHELRNFQRHPKYKTEYCHTFHSVGYCPYGSRCHFVHNAEKACSMSNQQQQQNLTNSDLKNCENQGGEICNRMLLLGPAYGISTLSSDCISPNGISSISHTNLAINYQFRKQLSPVLSLLPTGIWFNNRSAGSLL